MVAKRSLKREETDSTVVTSQKCLDSAYESLRASQEDFFKNRDNIDRIEEEEGEKKNPLVETLEVEGFALNPLNGSNPDGIERLVEMGSSQIKERRGKVMNLVKAFERLLTTSSSSKELDQENEEKAEDDEKEMESKEPETQISSASSCPSPFFFTSQSLGLDSGVDNSHGRLVIGLQISFCSLLPLLYFCE